jgi:Amidohydrolase
VQSEPDPDWLRRPDVIRGLRAVAAAGLCYDLVVRPHQLAAATYAAATVPGLTLVLDHAGKPPIATDELASWRAAIQAFAAQPNTVCKLSGLVTEAAPGAPESAFVPVADVILNAFGPGRIMVGSDWPVCLLAADYPSVLRLAQSLVAALSDAEQTAVFTSTAARVYGIPDLADTCHPLAPQRPPSPSTVVVTTDASRLPRPEGTRAPGASPGAGVTPAASSDLPHATSAPVSRKLFSARKEITV